MDIEKTRKQRLKIIDEIQDLRLLYELRNSLIVIYPNPEDSDKHISTVELLLEIEKVIWDRIDEIERSGDIVEWYIIIFKPAYLHHNARSISSLKNSYF